MSPALAPMTESLAQRLLKDVLGGSGPVRVSVIGLSKNAGKTVTLNHLIRAAAQTAVPLGLVSTGRDGEEQDAITELPKPRIWAPAGAWVATAKGALAAGTARIDSFMELPMATPFGPVILGRVAVSGDVLLIGPGSTARMTEVLGALESFGAQLCLVDGSFDRIAAAAPAVTGQVILAAGAAYSHSMGQTVAQVRHVLDLFDLPSIAADCQWQVENAMRRWPVSLLPDGGRAVEVPVGSALGDPEPIVQAALDWAGPSCLVLRGALGDRLLMSLLKRQVRTALVLPDATHVLVDRNLWRRWRGMGGQAFVLRQAHLVAVTTNPHSPVGRDYDAAAYWQAIAEIALRPVYDLEAGLSQVQKK
ncbi:MAG: hypothetical protein ACM3XM_11930 [Mycobacterium leprae]